jgi:DNA-binding IclR family transcriptional regulator
MTVMSAFHTTIATAVRLASRRRGVTAPELAEVTGSPASTARRTLALLARDGVLVAEVPERKGRRLGDWRTVYRMAKAR